MQLSYEQIRGIAHGAVRVVKSGESIQFHRFTEGQQETYRQASPDDFYTKTFSTSGVRLCFDTDSPFLRFDYRMIQKSSRPFGWFDLYENGTLIAHFGGVLDGSFTGREEVLLSAGQKRVEIHFPWSAAGEVLALELADGSFVRPVQKSRTMLAFGDSITQGYDAIYPSRSYVSQIADMLDASCINKGIGGEKFFPELLESDADIAPDIITVAYGTNDWSKRDRQSLETNCREFFSRLTRKYPQARIFAITPLWRKDNLKQTPFGSPLCEAVALIEEICREFPEVTVINGGGFTPRLEEFYSDARLHPNDLGFDFYAQNLYPQIMRELRK